MPVYRLTVHDRDWLDDPYGTALDEDDAARKEALAIAQEQATGMNKKPLQNPSH
jgi:hypothetical protein